MNHNPAPVRVFRVIGARVVNSTLVIENVDRGEFRGAGGCNLNARFLAEASGTAGVDRSTFCALDALRRHELY